MCWRCGRSVLRCDHLEPTVFALQRSSEEARQGQRSIQFVPGKPVEEVSIGKPKSTSRRRLLPSLFSVFSFLFLVPVARLKETHPAGHELGISLAERSCPLVSSDLVSFFLFLPSFFPFPCIFHFPFSFRFPFCLLPFPWPLSFSFAFNFTLGFPFPFFPCLFHFLSFFFPC